MLAMGCVVTVLSAMSTACADVAGRHNSSATEKAVMSINCFMGLPLKRC